MLVEEIPQEIQTVNRLFEECAAKGDFARIDQIYTKEARILPPGGEMVTGLARIRDFWQTAVSAMGMKSITLNTLSCEVAGEMAVEIGRADLVTEHLTPSSMTAKYVVVWKKQDGAWRWDVDIWNPAAS